MQSRQALLCYLLLQAALLLHAALGWSALHAAESSEGPDSIDAANPIDFVRDIQPILANNCLVCHGGDKAEGGLRLTRPEAATAELDSGSVAIVPGKVDESELIRRITAQDAAERMPPEGEPLGAAEIEKLKQWIAGGADWPVHWAYRPLDTSPAPAVKDAGWMVNPIDAFVLARLEAEGIAPAAMADRATLIKRLHYDLVGLPAQPEEVDAFLADQSADAYEKLVDRLLASPHFGERWGRHWLDVARYADSDGYEKDNTRPDAWRYRDWVIEATNADLPLDAFTIQQLAGDLIDGATPSQVLATAFHRQTLTNKEGGADQEQFRVDAVFDRVETTSTVWLGLTVGCARCHSHKYDQITQREYYQLFAFFNNGDEVDAEVPVSSQAWQDYLDRRKAIDDQLKPLEQELAAKVGHIEEQRQAWASEAAKMLRENVDTLQFVPLEIEKVEADSVEADSVEADSVEAESAVEAGSAVKTDSTVEFRRLDDGSWLASGSNPERARYVVHANTPAADIVGFQIEALADPSLPGGGPGRADNGNFVLYEFVVTLVGDSTSDQRRLQFVGAEADHSQGRYPVAKAIDGEDKTGWAIAPQMGKDHWARFALATPLVGGDRRQLKIELNQQHGTAHTLGRFRITAITGEKPAWQLPADVQAALKASPAEQTDEHATALRNYFAAICPATRELYAQVRRLEQSIGKPRMMSARVIRERTGDRRKNRLLHRGDFLQPEAEVEPGGLGVLLPLSGRRESEPADRLDLARWLVSPANPLTPRVTANQIWSKLVGRGIVRTLNDFGVRGERPTHPELLDWLAGELRRVGWRRKALIKTIVMSSTYRQSSHHRPELAERDPANDLFARQNRFRVDGELVRDLTLSAAGILSKKIGGPSVFPPMPAELRELTYAGNFQWKTSEGEDRLRRGMYTFHKRTAPDPNLITFDCPDGNTTRVQRDVSNTPLQALTTLNNEVFAEGAQGLARRVLEPSGLSDRERVGLAMRLCIARVPNEPEVARFERLLDASRQYYRSHPDDALRLVSKDYVVSQTPVEEQAAWIATARIILNLDEFLTRE